VFHAVVPVAQALDALRLHRIEQRHALRAFLKAVDRLDVVEQERQVEDLQFLRVARELGQRRRDELDVAEQQRLHLLRVTEQLRAREHLDLHLAGQELLGHFLELQRPLALGGRFGDDVAELDDDGLRKRGARAGKQRSTGDCGDQLHG
jgi:hypothetical protein